MNESLTCYIFISTKKNFMFYECECDEKKNTQKYFFNPQHKINVKREMMKFN